MPIPAKKQETSRISAKELIYSTLRDWIVDGTLQPGEHINDSEIAQYFAVSRTPVREAILLLEKQNLVDVIPSRGTRVASVNKEAAQAVYEALAGLSGFAARLACQKRQDSDIEILRQLNASFSDAVSAGEFKQLSQLDNEFHSYILKLAGNPHLMDFSDQLTAHAYRYENLYFLTGNDKIKSVQDHENMIDALENGDEERAQRCAEENWLDFYSKRLKPLL